MDKSPAWLDQRQGLLLVWWFLLMLILLELLDLLPLLLMASGYYRISIRHVHVLVGFSYLDGLLLADAGYCSRTFVNRQFGQVSDSFEVI